MAGPVFFRGVFAVVVLIGTVILSVNAGVTQQWATSNTDILLESFQWNSMNLYNPSFYAALQTNISQITGYHITHVWLPPPAQSADGHGYLPDQLNNLNSNYGSPTQLSSLVSSLNSAGVTAVLDAVLNHRVGSESNCDFYNPDWPSWYVTRLDEACSSGTGCSGSWPATCSNSNSSPTSSGCSANNNDLGVNYCAGRDLDYADSTVLTAVQTYLCSLRADSSSGGLQIPYGGVRYDMVVGYNTATFNAFNGVWPSNTWCTEHTSYTYTQLTFADQNFCVGENWVNGISLSDCTASQIATTVSELNSGTIPATGSNCALFDFATKYALTCAINNDNYALLKAGENPAGLIGVNALQSVTFVDNHDTGDADSIGSGQRLLPFDDSVSNVQYVENLAVGYAYILTHPGVPSIFAPHVFNFGSTISISTGVTLATYIQQLTNLRSTAGIQSNAGVYMCGGSSSYYAAYISPKNNGVYTVAMKIGPSLSWNVISAFNNYLYASGNNWAVWYYSTGVSESSLSGC